MNYVPKLKDYSTKFPWWHLNDIRMTLIDDIHNSLWHHIGSASRTPGSTVSLSTGAPGPRSRPLALWAAVKAQTPRPGSEVRLPISPAVVLGKFPYFCVPRIPRLHNGNDVNSCFSVVKMKWDEVPSRTWTWFQKHLVFSSLNVSCAVRIVPPHPQEMCSRPPGEAWINRESQSLHLLCFSLCVLTSSLRGAVYGSSLSHANDQQHCLGSGVIIGKIRMMTTSTAVLIPRQPVCLTGGERVHCGDLVKGVSYHPRLGGAGLTRFHHTSENGTHFKT